MINKGYGIISSQYGVEIIKLDPYLIYITPKKDKVSNNSLIFSKHHIYNKEFESITILDSIQLQVSKPKLTGDRIMYLQFLKLAII